MDASSFDFTPRYAIALRGGEQDERFLFNRTEIELLLPN
jgi:hypothetical protein